jgi:hypothetical protein
MAVFEERKPEIRKRARDAMKLGISHRGKQVGVGFLAFSSWRWSLPEGHPEKEKAYWTFTGFNIKPVEGDGMPKVCGEPVAVGAAITTMYDLGIALCVCSEPQIDDVSKVKTETLHSCHGCRTILRHLPIIRKETQFFGITPDKTGPEEELDFGSLLKLHNHCQVGENVPHI